MARNDHPHNSPENHRPEWWNGISLGNVITIAGGIVVAAIAWGSNEQKQTEQDRRIDKVETKIEILAEKAEQMAITQAAIKANIDLLVRAQGLEPVKAQP